MTSIDLYGILGLPATASSAEIQRAYRALALEHHPDRNTAAEAAARMSAVNDAYAVLGDPRRRREYDARSTRLRGIAALQPEILAAARALILRNGWRVVDESGGGLMLEQAGHRIRVLFFEVYTAAAWTGAPRRGVEPLVVMAAAVPHGAGVDEGRLRLPSGIVVFDLMLSEAHGAGAGTEPCKSLLAAFL